MAEVISCPSCRQKCRVPELTPGGQMQCPSCMEMISLKPGQQPSMLTRGPSADPLPPNRTMLAEPEVMVRYTCPRCKKSLESPVSLAGSKLNCPDCNQRIQIPQPSTPLPPSPNKTILAAEETAPLSAPAPSASTSAVPPIVTLQAVVEVPAAEPPTRRENCLECGVDVTRRQRVQSCPDCGSLFCSAACFREHRRHAHTAKRKKREYEAECNFCGSTERPLSSTAISEGGWIVFIILLILFFPLCWIGLLLTETRLHCADCGARLR